MTNLIDTAISQIASNQRVDCDALREAGHRQIATLIEDQIDDDTSDTVREGVIAQIQAYLDEATSK